MKLSIVIAAFNVEKYIKKCILSCIQDTRLFEYEVVVVNDGSTDQTLNILQTLEPLYANLKVISQENTGLGGARNTGLNHAKGDYIWFIDGDDYLQQDILADIIHETTTKDLDALILDYAVVDESYKVLEQHQNTIHISEIITGGDYYETHFSKSYTWMFVFKRSLFTTNNLIFKERINMQDSEILPKIMNHIKRLTFLNKVCYFYLQQPESFTNSEKGGKRYNYFESIIAVSYSLQEFLSSIEDENPKIALGIKKKLLSFHHIVYNHLVYVPYEKKWLIKIIELLKIHAFYPLQFQGDTKVRLIVILMNTWPVSTKKAIDVLRNK